MRRRIPATGEELPAIGVGTWQTFDVASGAPERRELAEVLRALAEAGGSVVDSSPMYGRAPRGVVGELLAETGLRERLFLATKVWTSGRREGERQMAESSRLMHAPRLDLMQIHNLLDWRTHLATMQRLRAEGRVRYLGVTHYTASAYGELMEVLKTRQFDFAQFNFSVGEREAERRLLPLCGELGVAVIVNRPFAFGELFSQVRGRPLPDWAADIDCTSWAQLLLKWILAVPAVTCVIPGTRRVAHMRDNAGAGLGRLPDAAQRKRILQAVGAA